MQVELSEHLAHTIAIVGIHGRYPGSSNLEEFWSHLIRGEETISFFSEQELREAGVSEAQIANPAYVRARGVYRNPLAFDAGFFGYNPREAEILDPQQRIFLECSWEALEIAGYDPARYSGRIGVFAGAGITQYLWRLLGDPVLMAKSPISVLTANDKDYVATRVGYKLNLNGPCVTVQTACSTSLVAVVLGCQSLQAFQADMVLAGGVSVVPEPVGGYMYEEGGILSPDGHCRSFDAAAKGTIFSSGVGVAVLKRTEDALRDGDQIYAVIRAFAFNNDGGRRAGFTTPGVDGQTAVSLEALSTGGVDPESISYVECHGTGTVVGDPIEIRALTKAFSQFTSKKQFCAVGSVKTNIGHADAAAGLAGLSKVVYSLRNRTLPGILHFSSQNPSIRFEDTPFFPNTTLREWQAAYPRRAAVNSFGIGGTNAQVIVEEAPPLVSGPGQRKNRLLIWSARSDAAAEQVGVRLADHLQANIEEKLDDVAFTLQVGRRAFEQRRWCVSEDRARAVDALRAGHFSSASLAKGARAPELAFIFPGQGAQFPNMGAGLYAEEPEFRRALDRCLTLFSSHLGVNLAEMLFPPEAGIETARAMLNQTVHAQPALFSVEWALATLWQSWGIQPAGMLGHSIGEYVAACLAGVMTLEDAARLVALRGRLMQALPGGAMIAVLEAENVVSELVAKFPELSIAALNASRATVVSGPTDAILQLRQALDSRKVEYRALRTSHAFHSSMMSPILPEFEAAAAAISLKAPAIPFLSNVTGTWITEEQATSPRYWAEHIRSAVRFADGVRALSAGHYGVALEVGPGSAMSSLIQQETQGKLLGLSSLGSGKAPTAEEPRKVTEALGQIWGAGIEPDWHRYYGREQRRRVALPTYPFERQEYGVASGPRAAPPPKSAESAAVSDRNPFDKWFYSVNWYRTLLPRATEGGAACRFLLIGGESPANEQLADRLRLQGHTVVRAMPKGCFERLSKLSYQFDLNSEEDMVELLARLEADGVFPQRIVHALALEESQPAALSHYDASMARVFYSPLSLLKALARRASGEPLQLTFLCSRAFDVVGGEVVTPIPAMLAGPMGSAANEFPNIQSLLLDCELDQKRCFSQEMLGHLVAELRSEADGLIVYRQGYRWARRFEQLAAPVAMDGTLFRQGATYLITGGLTGIGLAMAKYLAATFSARLILISRTALPAKTDWAASLADPAVEPGIKERIVALRDLEERGAEVYYAAADISDRQRITGILQDAEARLGNIRGVIHCAGVPGAGISAFKTRAAADSVLLPKVKGTLLLDELLHGEDLDFFALCSSITALKGSAGQIDYTAANAFLDAYAWSRNGERTRFVAVNWDRWEDVGMAARYITATEQKRRLSEVRGSPETSAYGPFSGREAAGKTTTFTLRCAPETHWMAGEHKVMATPTIVGTAHLEYVRAAYCQSYGQARVEITDLIYLQPVMFATPDPREVHYSLTSEADGSCSFVVWSSSGQARQEHARGRVAAHSHDRPQAKDVAATFAACRSERRPSITGVEDREGTVSAVIDVGPRWDLFKRIAESEEVAIAELSLSEVVLGDLGDYPLHAAVLDCALSYVAGPRGISNQLYLPLAFKGLRVHAPLTARMYSIKTFPKAAGASKETLSCDVTLVNEQGEVLLEVHDFTVKRVSGAKSLGLGAKSGTERKSADGGVLRITEAEGVDAFVRILGEWSLPQAVVAVLGPDSYQRHTVKEEEDAAESEAGAAEAKHTNGGKRIYARPALEVEYVEPRSDVERNIAAIWRELLGIGQIGVRDDFVDLGGHSLLAVQLIARIREEFSIDFSVSEFYQSSTVEGMAALILEKLVSGMDESELQSLIAETAA